MKLALVHDFLLSYGGAEKTLIALHNLWPEAPIYTLIADNVFLKKYLPEARIITSRLQHMPHSARLYRPYGLFMPWAIESLDLSAFDTVISSSVNFSKGVVVRPSTRHICYCYSPSRPLWDRAHAYEYGGKLKRHVARLWDVEAAQRVDHFVAISDHIRQRIGKYYRREADVIYPPVAELPKPLGRPLIEPYTIVISRLVPHKNLELIIDTFNKMRSKIVIVGDGPLRAKLSARAEKNILFTGFLDAQELATWLGNAQALILPCEEDFGLTAAEALQLGVPVLALRKGGALEIVEEGITGEFFDDPIPEALADGMKRLKQNTYHRDVLQSAAARFSPMQFSKAFQNLISA